MKGKGDTMLLRLVVTNFAIIENMDIEFKDGLTVLTGETGAGKSLIIDSLSLLLGERASTELIRAGKDKAVITGYFKTDSIYLKSALEKKGISILNDEIVIERAISQTKSYIKVNNTYITLQELKSLSKYLADIHMQFDNEKILNPENYLDIIDGFKYELTQEYLNHYLDALNTFKTSKNNYLSLVKKQKEIESRKEFYEYELKELESMNLISGEDEKLKEEIDLLKNYDKIYALFQNIDSLIREDFNDKLYEVKDNLEKLSEYQPSYKESYEKLNDYYYEIDSIFSDLKKDFSKLDYDPNKLDTLLERENELSKLKKKYNKTIDELIEYIDELKSLLSLSENFDEKINELKDIMIKSYDDTYSKALDLTKIRKEISKSIEKELEKNMSDLSLKAVFKVDFKEINKEKDCEGLIFTEKGIDVVDFLIETNIGEGLKSLSKTVSGGESSRIMLAIKALFIKSQKIPTVIFDEIDTGISGEVARKVALKIYEISLSSQVISITHLPQVASLSKNHLKISKEVINGRTYTNMKELSLDEKIYEIALMISGGKVTNSQLEYAKEMVLNK